MIVLHGALVGRQLHLWGESPPTSPPQKAHRGRGERGARPSPYATQASRLIPAIAEAVPGLAITGTAPQRLVGWLPTAGGAPLPSSPLLTTATNPPATGGATRRLAPWVLETIRIAPPSAVLVLCAAVGRDTLAPGLVVSSDLAFWALVLRFAGALVARERFLPGIVETEEGLRARWTPVLDAADAQRRIKLASAMPGACRALSGEAAEPPPGTALEAVDHVVAMLVDQLVRTAAAGTGPVAEPESGHEAWLRALAQPDGVIGGGPADVARLAAAVREWRRPVAISSDAPFRLCFRLEEPAEKARGNGHRPWSVRYLLQARRDPSLLIPAERAWQGHAAERLLGAPQVREHLLASLGQAAPLCPPVEQSLHGPAPSGYTTDSRGAHAFLTQSAAALEQAGFGVLLPSWWTGKGTRLRLGARAQVRSPKMKEGGAGVGLEELVHVDWQIVLGDDTLTPAELSALAKMKEPLVRVRGQWVHMTAEEIRAALDLWRTKKGATPVRDVLRIALGATTTVGALAVEGVEAAGWIGDVLARLEGHAGFQDLPPPPGLQATLRPYQRRGYSWLAFLRAWGLGACLADDMGLGKTVQTLCLLLAERATGNEKPALVVCPTSVIGNWQREAERFTPSLRVLVHHGVGRGRGEAFLEKAREHGVVVTSYALLLRDLEHFGAVDWSTVVLDEAQNIKNPETRQARSARALPAAHRIALTGTPVENNVGDLWSIMEFLNPGLLGSQAEFKRSFFVPIHAARDAGAMARLRRLTGPFILRRLKTDRSVIADLPEKMEMKVFCTLTREQASLYQAVLSDAEKAIAKAEGIQRKGVVLATLSKLKQVCNHPAQLLADNSPVPGRSGKLARVTEMMQEVIESGERALVFSQFAEMGAILTAHLQETFGREVLFLHGGVPRGQRERMVERFQSDPDGPPVFVLSLKAGGTGLNLTRASHVFHFDRWWNPAVEAQATDRAFRIGQTRRVQVHKLVCLGTLEEKIDAMIESKKGVAEQVVGTGEGWLTELSTAELRQVLALRPEAVGE
ncbi:MAG TPA: DEAD/DEAH box helicase [Vicinamibacteria bacterium]